MVYQVKLETFEGPLGLLLQLIEEQKLDITQISLAQVSNDFLRHLKTLDNVNLKYLSEFLDVASKLILAKTKVLLPQLELTGEEQEDLEELKSRLKEYQAFKKVSEELKELAESEFRGFNRQTKVSPKISVFDPPDINTKALFEMFQKALENMPKEEELDKAIIKDSVSTEEKIKELKEHLNKFNLIKFGEFLRKAKSKIGMIVSFLAILELLRLKVLEAKQDSNFSEIILIRATRNKE